MAGTMSPTKPGERRLDNENARCVSHRVSASLSKFDAQDRTAEAQSMSLLFNGLWGARTLQVVQPPSVNLLEGVDWLSTSGIPPHGGRANGRRQQ